MLIYHEPQPWTRLFVETAADLWPGCICHAPTSDGLEILVGDKRIHMTGHREKDHWIIYRSDYIDRRMYGDLIDEMIGRGHDIRSRNVYGLELWAEELVC